MTPVRKMYFHLLSLQEGASAWLRTHSLARVPPARAHLCFPASSGYTQFPPTFPPLPEETLGLVLRFLRDIRVLTPRKPGQAQLESSWTLEKQRQS